MLKNEGKGKLKTNMFIKYRNKEPGRTSGDVPVSQEALRCPDVGWPWRPFSGQRSLEDQRVGLGEKRTWDTVDPWYLQILCWQTCLLSNQWSWRVSYVDMYRRAKNRESPPVRPAEVQGGAVSCSGSPTVNKCTTALHANNPKTMTLFLFG